MPYDLDPADLAEVRRRVVDPLLAAMFRPGELASVALTFGAAPPFTGRGVGHGSGHGLWLTVAADDDTCQVSFGDVPFAPVDADDAAAALEERLQDWFCETAAGWAQFRALPAGWRALPAPLPDGGRTLTLAPTYGEGGLPLWEAGQPADADPLGLPEELVADLRAWQELATSHVEADRPFPPAWLPVDAGPYASSLTIVYGDIAALEAEEAAAAAADLRQWRRFMAAGEALRDDLLARLRAELGAGFHVPEPTRLP